MTKASETRQRLAALRSEYPRARPNARTVAGLRDNPSCSARRVMDAAEIDKAKLAGDLGKPFPEGQSRFALQRGDRFEADVKANGYAVAIQLLREAGFPEEPVRVLPLREIHPFGKKSTVDSVLSRRAADTRKALVAMAKGAKDAYNLIDGGALVWDFGGAVARLETDGVAWRFGGLIRVVEIKSFPIVDRRADPEKVGAAAWQGAVYVAAIKDLLEEEGLSPDLASTEMLLICPRNTSLTGTVTTIDVQRHVRVLRRLLENRASMDELLARLPKDMTLDLEGMADEDKASHVAEMLRHIGTHYVPNCLNSCPLAFHCRSLARESGDPSHLGQPARAGLAGVASLGRAAELAGGARPGEDEEDTAVLLTRVGRALATEVTA